MIKIGLKLFKWLLVLVVLVGAFSWFVFNVGEAGWVYASKTWSQVSSVVMVIKFVIAAIMVIYWRELCAYAGRQFKNDSLWLRVADNGRVFVVMVVVIELVGLLR